MIKIFNHVLAVLCAAVLCAGCGSQSAGGSGSTSASPPSSAAPPSVSSEAGSGEPLRVAALRGPTAMGMVYLMEQAQTSGTEETLSFTLAGSADEITPKLVQGEIDLAAVPANLASVLYNTTDGQVRVLAVNTLGVLYIVEKGERIQSVEDLKGKTIYASGKGVTPEYALNYVLEANGIDPVKDVRIEFKSEHAECVAALAADPAGIAMLPQPFATTAQMKDSGIRIALDLNAEWDKAQSGEETQSALVTGVLVARAEVLEQRPEAVDAFLNDYRASTARVNENTKEAAALVGKYNIVPQEVAEKALPLCNITYLDGAEMKEKLGGYLEILLRQNPKAVGGAVPDEAFYYGA